MTKKELIEAMEDFPDDMTVLAYSETDDEPEFLHINKVEYAQPFVTSDKKVISLSLY